jgi:hypothetical protein
VALVAVTIIAAVVVIIIAIVPIITVAINAVQLLRPQFRTVIPILIRRSLPEKIFSRRRRDLWAIVRV